MHGLCYDRTNWERVVCYKYRVLTQPYQAYNKC